MNIRSRSYDRIALITVTGPISPKDLVVLEEDMTRIARAYDYVIVSLGKSEAREVQIIRLTTTRNNLSLRKLWYVHQGFKTADFSATSAALKATEVPIAIRLAQSRIIQKQLHSLTERLEGKQIEFSDILRAALGEEELGIPLSDEDWESKQQKLLDELSRLRIIFKTLSAPIQELTAEVARLQSTPQADPEATTKVKEAKIAAITTLKSLGVISDGKSR